MPTRDPAAAYADLTRQTRAATAAMGSLAEALRPRTEREFWDWLRYNNPLGYIAARHGLGRRIRRFEPM